MSEDSTAMSGNNGHRNDSTSTGVPTPDVGRPKTLWEQMTDPFNSVWLGIWLLFLIFLYMTIGSAGIIYPTDWNIIDTNNWVHIWPRELPWIEKTELGFFNWWPFTLLIALFALNLTIVTMRRIAFKWINAGVITIHFGILVLCAGSLYYFTTKVEGEAIVHRRQALIETPDGQRGTLIISPEARARIGSYMFQVSDTNPDWPLRSEGFEGKSAYAAFINVTTPERTFTRQLLDGYPQFTEDIIPGQGRAKKVMGQTLVDDGLKINLDYAPTTWFSVQQTAAVFVRPLGGNFWHERPIDDLPRYNEYIASRDWVWSQNLPEDFPLRLIDQEARTRQDDPFQDVKIRVTGYLPYAQPKGMYVHSGTLNPYAKLRLGFADPSATSDDRSQTYELYAFDPRRNTASEGRLHFVWVNSKQELNALSAPVEQGSVTVRIPNKDVEQVVLMSELAPLGSNEKPSVSIGDTGYAVRLDSVLDNFAIPSGPRQGESLSVAIVEITKPDGTLLRRFATDQIAMAKDVSDDHGMSDPDPAVEVVYQPGTDLRLTLASGPGDIGTHLFLAVGGEVIHNQLQIGQPVTMGGSLQATLLDVMADAQYEERPMIVPHRLRDSSAKAQQTYAMIRVELTTKDGWSDAVWLPYHSHAFENSQYAFRYRYSPTVVPLPGGRRLEMMYSRQQLPLPAAVALKDFHLDTHEGGLIGMNANVANYYSDLVFYDGDKQEWTDEQLIRVNGPGKHDDFLFFQATWDPPAPNIGHAGMNYTGLGVSNRNYSVHIQLIGCCIAVAGMLYAFLVKPIIRRRTLEAALNTHGASARDAAMRRGVRSGAGAEVEEETVGAP